MKQSRWKKVIDLAYRRMYDACLPLDESNYFGLAIQGSAPFTYRMKGEAEDDAYIIGRALSEFDSVHPSFRKAIVCNAVYATYLDSSFSLESLRTAAQASIHRWKSKPEKLFQTWIHLDVSEIPDELAAVQINGHRLNVVNGNSLYSRMDEERLERLSRRSQSDKADRLSFFVSGEYRATSSNIALDYAVEDFAVLRGVLNWHPKLRTRSWSIGTTQEACKHYPPLVYGVTNEHGEVEAHPGYGVSSFANKPVDPKFIGEIRDMLSFFAPKHEAGSVRLLLAEAISIGSNGLDSIYPLQQFLSYWTALERIALADRGNPSEVAKHIARLWIDAPGSITEFILDTLATDRNQLVHEGKFESDDETRLGLMMEIVASAFWRLQAISSDIPTANALRSYYNSARLTKGELKVKAKGISFATKMRAEMDKRGIA